jgi:hypothetical protein
MEIILIQIIPHLLLLYVIQEILQQGINTLINSIGKINQYYTLVENNRCLKN